MSEHRSTSWLAWILGILGIAGALTFLGLEMSDGTVRLPTFLQASQEALGAMAFAVVGILLATRLRRNALGWLLLVMGVSYSLSAIGAGLTDSAARGSTLWQWGTWLNTWVWAPGWFGLVTFVLLLFPDGRPPTARWRWVGWVAGLAIAIEVIGGALNPTAGGTAGYHSPLPTFPGSDLGMAVGMILMAVAAIGSISALVVRYRRSQGDLRLQMKWFVYAGVITIALSPTRTVSIMQPVVLVIGVASTLILPIAIGIAVLKYRLYDIDLVIRKTVVVGLLASFITVVYVALVVGIGSRFSDTLTLQIVATAVVAVAFQPVRTWTNRLANRLVYGKRATPYEVLARFADRIGDTYASEDVVGRIAHVIADGTGSERVEVWLRLGDELRRTGTWPTDLAARSVPLLDGGLPPLGGDRLAPVRHLGETLGAITITKPTGEPLTPNEADLLDRLADQSGLVLANVRLTADLEARLEQIARQAAELRASRQRIVAAQDEERRRLERNIHDGAQQHLVALAVKLRLARTMLERDPERGRAMLQEITGEIEAARETIHALALGIYPPHLEAEGIAAALTAQVERGTLPVHMDADGIGRHPIDIEAAIYFCVLEALQNAAKYAKATRIDVRLREADGGIVFEVRDDGRGFDPSANSAGTGLAGMRDRLAVFGGTAAIRSAPGAGTVVTGGVPIPLEVPA